MMKNRIAKQIVWYERYSIGSTKFRTYKWVTQQAMPLCYRSSSKN